MRRGDLPAMPEDIHGSADWLVAVDGHYSFRCRQQAWEPIAAGDSVEQSAPHSKDPTRLPDPSTLRRWASGDCSACGAGLKPGTVARTFL